MADEQEFIPPQHRGIRSSSGSYCGTAKLNSDPTPAERVQIEGHRALWLNSSKISSLRELRRLSERGLILRGAPGGRYYLLQLKSPLGPILRSYTKEPRLFRRDRLRLVSLNAVDQETVDWMLNLPSELSRWGRR